MEPYRDLTLRLKKSVYRRLDAARLKRHAQQTVPEFVAWLIEIALNSYERAENDVEKSHRLVLSPDEVPVPSRLIVP